MKYQNDRALEMHAFNLHDIFIFVFMIHLSFKLFSRCEHLVYFPIFYIIAWAAAGFNFSGVKKIKDKKASSVLKSHLIYKRIIRKKLH